MKRTCIICGNTKGKRACQLHENDMICPVCCAITRQELCEGCRHYSTAQQFQAAKTSHADSGHFIAEINEDVANEVDRALMLCEKRSFSKALSILQGLMIAHPRNYQAHYGMGVYHLLQSKYDEALKCFDRATDIFPLCVEAFINKGMIYKLRFDIKNMVQAFQRAVEIGDPQDEDVKNVQNILQGIEQNIRQNNHISLKDYINGNDKFDLGIEAMENCNWEQAILQFQQSIRYNPRHPQSFGNIGICYGKLGQKSKAIQAFDEALKLDPNYEPAMVNRAAVEALPEGGKLHPGKVGAIEYYKEFPRKKKSLIRALAEKFKNK